MKKYIFIITTLLLTLNFGLSTVIAQSPNKISYQAVVRDAENNLVSNQDISMRISVICDSVDGTIEFMETHQLTTNTNGLATIVIGTGVRTTNPLSEIDWANGLYFIKSEIDLEGGDNYTITGTSQLLSVPYALHAKTAESIPGMVTSYSVGDYAHGGVVFWVDETGQHGLVCAIEDQSDGVRWYAGTYGYTQAKGDGPLSGENNTAIIIAAQVAIGDDGSTYAARLCNELQVTSNGITYCDWYLPSKEELNMMYENAVTINITSSANGGSNLASSYYWSSTEDDNNIAWRQAFINGVQLNHSKSYESRVRAIRAF